MVVADPGTGTKGGGVTKFGAGVATATDVVEDATLSKRSSSVLSNKVCPNAAAPDTKKIVIDAVKYRITNIFLLITNADSTRQRNF